MIKKLIIAGAMLAAISSCKMENPFLTESKAPYGAPEFDKIKTEHYMPAFEAAIAEAQFMTPSCPVYQNVDAQPYTDAETIKKNLIAQLTAPVRWTQIAENMIADGVTEFTEVGPGNVLQGLVSKVSREVAVESKSTL